MMFLCLWYASAFCTLWRIPLGPVSGPPPITPFLQLYRLSVMIGFHWARRVPTFLSHGEGHSVLSLFSYFPSIPDPGSSLPSKVSLSSFHLQPQVNTSNKTSSQFVASDYSHCIPPEIILFCISNYQGFWAKHPSMLSGGIHWRMHNIIIKNVHICRTLILSVH